MKGVRVLCLKRGATGYLHQSTSVKNGISRFVFVRANSWIVSAPYGKVRSTKPHETNTKSSRWELVVRMILRIACFVCLSETILTVTTSQKNSFWNRALIASLG